MAGRILSFVGCCSHGGYERIFGAKQARKDLRRYRRRGLARDARAAVDFLRSRGVEGATAHPDSVGEVQRPGGEKGRKRVEGEEV